VAEAAVALLTTINGQWCRGLGRVILPAARADELLEAILAALAEVRIGDPLDPATAMGPICHHEHLDTVTAQVAALEAAGGTAHRSTPIPDARGNWMAPVLITGLDAGRTDDEVFGPVASVLTYDGIDDAVRIANDTRYGLEAYVVGTDEDAAMAVGRSIRAGGVKINGASPISLNLMAPRPAFGVSGLAEEGTVETITFFGGNRVVGVEGALGAGPGPG
jgi:phenylacetaldehyde dehydrogenase